MTPPHPDRRSLAPVAPDPCSAAVVQTSSSPMPDQSTVLLPAHHRWPHPTCTPSPLSSPRSRPRRNRPRRLSLTSTAGRCICLDLGRGGGGCRGESSIALGLRVVQLRQDGAAGHWGGAREGVHAGGRWSSEDGSGRAAARNPIAHGAPDEEDREEGIGIETSYRPNMCHVYLNGPHRGTRLARGGNCISLTE